MVRRKTLAEELEDLATTAPTREYDPEAGIFGKEAVLEATDDELEQAQDRLKRKEKGLLLRGALDLEDAEYAGKTVSRDAIFGDESEEDISDEEDLEAAGDESELEDFPRDEGEDNEDQRHPSIADAEFEGQEPALGAEADVEAAELEREFEAARADAGDAAAATRKRAVRERAKGLAVKNQRALWERMLELRILLQSCLQASNRLVRPHMHAGACAVAPELRSGLHGLADGAAATLDSLLDLHDTLLDRVPDLAAATTADALAEGASVKPGSKKRGREGDAEDGALSGAKWARINAAYGRFAPFRNASLDRWHRKTMLMSGSGALRSNLRALNQSLSSQVAALVKDSGPAVQRTQIIKAQIKPLMGHVSAQAAQDEEAEDEEEHDTAMDERDTETFDDGEFYQQLLKEFLEGSGVDAAAVNASAQGAKKKRKNVDRRASKGRKLRYQVMEKLVHFMAPVQRAEPPVLAAQLVSNLFGQSSSTAVHI